jgi:hypothetical protein
MSKYIRYTCNKKNEPVFKLDCVTCPEYNPCAKDGKWCFIGALVEKNDQMCSEAHMPSAESAAAPILRDMSTVTINLGDGMKVEVLHEDIKKQLEQEFYRNLGLFFGA